jgi:hypothetical protein
LKNFARLGEAVSKSWNIEQRTTNAEHRTVLIVLGLSGGLQEEGTIGAGAFLKDKSIFEPESRRHSQSIAQTSAFLLETPTL